MYLSYLMSHPTSPPWNIFRSFTHLEHQIRRSSPLSSRASSSAPLDDPFTIYISIPRILFLSIVFRLSSCLFSTLLLSFTPSLRLLVRSRFPFIFTIIESFQSHNCLEFVESSLYSLSRARNSYFMTSTTSCHSCDCGCEKSHFATSTEFSSCLFQGGQKTPRFDRQSTWLLSLVSCSSNPIPGLL